MRLFFKSFSGKLCDEEKSVSGSYEQMCRCRFGRITLSLCADMESGEPMGLRDYLKKHEVKEDKDAVIRENEEEGTTIDIGNAFKALKNLKKRKS